MLNRDAIGLSFDKYDDEKIAISTKAIDQKVIVDGLIIGSFILGAEIISQSLFMIGLFIYMLYKIICDKSLYAFPYLLILLPNLGAIFIPGVPAPLLNLLVPFAIVKMIITERTKRLDVELLVVTLFLFMYEFLHIFLYNLNNLFTMTSWVLVIFYVVMVVSDDKHNYNHEICVKYFVAGVTISSIYGLYSNLVNLGSLVNFNQTNVTDRFAGAAGDPNYYSLYVLVALFSLTSLLDRRRNLLSKAAHVGYFVVLPIVASMSLSRMYLIVLAITGLLYILRVMLSLYEYNIHKKALLLIFSIGTGIALALPVNIMNNVNLVLERFTMYKGDLTALTSNRNLIASYILNFLRENPLYLLFGVGIQGYGDRIGVGVGYAHNILLELLAASGIVGTLLFAFFVAMLLYKVREHSRGGSRRRVRVMGALPLIAIAISYMAINAIEVESFYILLLFAMKNMWYAGVDEE